MATLGGDSRDSVPKSLAQRREPDKCTLHLWPDTDVAKGVDKFWFQMRTVRNHLRNDNAPTAKFIDKFDDAYRPVPELFIVDVWAFDRLKGAENTVTGLPRLFLMQPPSSWLCRRFSSPSPPEEVDPLVSFA
jgi:hypothetical protein